MSTEVETSAQVSPEISAKIRLDKWLWFARIVKTRTLAQKLITGGNVRVDGERAKLTSQKVGAGQTLTISVADAIKILEIVAVGERRGPAPEAQLLYNDHSPIIPNAERPWHSSAPGKRDKGAGRPTKKERRETDDYNDTED